MTVGHNGVNHIRNGKAVWAVAEFDGSYLIESGRSYLFDRGGRTYEVKHYLQYGWSVIRTSGDSRGSQVIGGRHSAEEAFTDACPVIDREDRKEAEQRSADAELRDAWPEPPKTPLEALRHVLDVYRGEDDTAYAIRATTDRYNAAPETGLTYGDLKALLQLIEQSS